MPRLEKITEIGDGLDLGNGCRGRCISEGTGHNLEAVDDFVVGSGSRYGAVGMTKLDCVGDDLALGVTLDQFETAIQVKCRPNVEAVLRTEIP
jgi:hypothetical protein